MRDIREDLRERIELLVREKQTKEIEITAIEQKIAMLDGLLQQEEERQNPASQVSLSFGRFEKHVIRSASGDKYSSPLSLAVLHVFRSHNPAGLEQFKAQALRDGVEFGGKYPGRAIHFLLLGMEQNGLVKRTSDGRWSLIKDIFGEGKADSKESRQLAVC